MAIQTFAEKEKELGSSAFIWWLAFTNFLISVLFVASSFIVGLIFKGFLVQMHAGVWAIIVMNMSQRSVEYPETEVNFWGFPMKHKFVPFVLVGVFSLLAQAVLLDLFAAVAVGIFYRRLRLDWWNLKPAAANKFEKLFPCCRIWKHGGPWLAPPTGGFMQGLYNDLSSFQAQHMNPAQQAQNPLELFTGQGQRLGESVPQAQNLIQEPSAKAAAAGAAVAESAEEARTGDEPQSPQAPPIQSGHAGENV